MNKTYSWKINGEAINQEIVLSDKGNMFVGTSANSFRASIGDICRKYEWPQSQENIQYLVERFWMPALSKKIGVTILTEVL